MKMDSFCSSVVWLSTLCQSELCAVTAVYCDLCAHGGCMLQVKWRPTSSENFPFPDLTSRPTTVAEQPKPQGNNIVPLVVVSCIKCP